MSKNNPSPTGRLVTPEPVNTVRIEVEGNPTHGQTEFRYFEDPYLRGLGSMSTAWHRERDRKGQ